jgi:uncharacterized protein (DUF934 family)
MPRIIRKQEIVEDSWQVLSLTPDESARTVPLPAGAVLLPLAVWLARRDEVLQRDEPPGVWLDSDEGPEALADDCARFAVIGINFPRFTDGRGYSSARLLRERYHYAGEIRAIGDVLHDQLFLMRRCGIDAYALRADKDIEQALAGLRAFSESYQAAADQPLPLFRRRLAKHSA